MIINNAKLELLAVDASGYPKSGYPEIAFAGRSNVGKSSLINCLTRRKALARTSSAPGKTRTLNFYNIEELFYFVDLPGYGYAKVAKSEKAKWGKMIEGYLRDRTQLKAVALLLDIRHEPTQNDVMLLEWLEHYQCPWFIVATKSDKIKRSQLQKHLSVIRKKLELDADDLIVPFSALNKQGVAEVWEVLASILA